MNLRRYFVLAGLALLGACSDAPTGPRADAGGGALFDEVVAEPARPDSFAAGGVGTLGSGN